MARPKKHKELKRNHQIMLRLTDTEYENISSNAKNASLPVAEYARKLITGKPPKITYEVVADLPELKKLIGEFENGGRLPLPLCGTFFHTERSCRSWPS